jgi:excisionase family DNA binding protein
MEPMMTAREVAELLGQRESWVYAQAALGTLPSYKIGGSRRFRRPEIDNWQAELRPAPARDPRGRSAPEL